MMGAPCSSSLAEDVDLDGLRPGRPDVDDAPHWLWVLVRVSPEPLQRVWVRFPAEACPEGVSVRAAPPKPGSIGVAVFPRASRTMNAPSVEPSLAAFVAHVQAVARERRAVLAQLQDALLRRDDSAALKLARDVVGLGGS